MGISKMKAGDKGSGLPGDQFAGQQKIVVRFKGPFDWTYTARTLQRWFEQRRFRFYENRIKDTGKRIKADWYAQRDIDEFWAERYDIKIEMWHLSSQEVMVNGEPRKIINGMAQFTIKDTTITDRNHFFKGSKFKEFLGKLYMEMRWREAETDFLDVHQYRAQDIATVIQECLNMSTKHKAPW
ncbi:hypothetical protein GOV07_00115 [Candidatus Woesearchaeota archaeon]|nr:hypothetical protein [Candidatus Woesearchaeota archaeon]